MVHQDPKAWLDQKELKAQKVTLEKLEKPEVPDQEDRE